MATANSPDSTKRLVICLVVVFAATVFCGLWAWPMMQGHAWHERTASIHKGMSLAEVVRILGRPNDESPANWAPRAEDFPHVDRFYCWTRYPYRFVIGVKDDQVVYIATHNEGMAM